MLNVAALCSLALASATFVSAAPVLKRQESIANCLVVATQTGGLADEALTSAIDFALRRELEAEFGTVTALDFAHFQGEGGKETINVIPTVAGASAAQLSTFIGSLAGQTLEGIDNTDFIIDQASCTLDSASQGGSSSDVPLEVEVVTLERRGGRFASIAKRQASAPTQCLVAATQTGGLDADALTSAIDFVLRRELEEAFGTVTSLDFAFFEREAGIQAINVLASVDGVDTAEVSAFIESLAGQTLEGIDNTEFIVDTSSCD